MSGRGQKLKEYLAKDKPVIARELPPSWVWADCVALATSPNEFSAARKRLVRGVTAEQQTGRCRFRKEDWGEKAPQFERGMFRPYGEGSSLPQLLPISGHESVVLNGEADLVTYV